MNSNVLKSSALLATAIGAGIAIGAAGVFIYERLLKERRRLILQEDVVRLGATVSELQNELQELRETQTARRKRQVNKPDNSSAVSVSESDVEMMSMIDDDEEFFDFSDVEDTSSVAGRHEWQETKGTDHLELDQKINDPELSVKLGALEELKNRLKSTPNSPDVLWRLAKVCHGIALIKGIMGEVESKKDFINQGVEYATQCLAEAPRSADAHKWYAICVGSRGEFQPTKNKIKDGFIFKEHVEEALRLSPHDPTLLHLLGRFRYEVATLSWWERKLAHTIYGEIPNATFEEAIESLLKVEESRTDPWKENRLILAKCYIHLEQYDKALHWLDKAYEIDATSLEERELNEEIQRLRTTHENHRKKGK